MAGLLTLPPDSKLPSRRTGSSGMVFASQMAVYSSGTVQDFHLIPFLITPLVNLLRLRRLLFGEAVPKLNLVQETSILVWMLLLFAFCHTLIVPVSNIFYVCKVMVIG